VKEHNFCYHNATVHELLEAHSGLVHDFEDACIACGINEVAEADLVPEFTVPADCENPAPANVQVDPDLHQPAFGAAAVTYFPTYHRRTHAFIP
jgi:hypothetical protein